MSRPRLLSAATAATTAAAAVGMLLGPMVASVALAATPSVVVQPGDTLSTIALRHGTTTERLVAINHLTDANRIYVGERLLLAPAASAAPVPAPAPRRVHLVVVGEHLTGIAARYGTTIAELARINHLANPNLIRAGQRLLVPGDRAVSPAPAAAPVASTLTHRIAPGENLTRIASRYHTSVAAIVALNHLRNASFIRAGDTLRIPSSRAPMPASAASFARLDPDTARRMASRAAVRDLIIAEARRAGVPATLALAVGWQESGWRQGVVSSAGAIGVMQLLPATGAWVGSAMLGNAVNLRDIRQNVRAGVTLLRHYLVRYHGDQARALAAYYQGQRSVDEHGIYPVSRPYIASIQALQALLRP